MSNKSKIVILIVLAAMIVLGVSYFMGKNQKKKFNWQTNFKHDNAEPYGAKVLYDLLKTYHPNMPLEFNESKFIKNYLAERKKSGPANYFLIGDTYFTQPDLVALIDFMHEGNTVFIVSRYAGSEIFEKINRICPPEYNVVAFKDDEKSIVNENFADKNFASKDGYNYHFQFVNDTVWYQWRYMTFENCKKNEKVKTLGFANGDKKQVTFAQMPVGKGQLLVHTNPVAFTNFHLLRKEGIEYAGKVFSYLPEAPIIWDRYSTLWKFLPDSPKGNERRNPLGYILKQRSFKWSYYTILIMAIVFLLFNLWRKQRAIPPLFANTNTSLEYMKSMGELFYKHKDNRKIGIQKMEFFLKTMRQKYYLKESDTEKFIEQLAKKSEVDIKEIQAIFKQYEAIKKISIVSDSFLYGFYQNIENFKRKSK